MLTALLEHNSAMDGGRANGNATSTPDSNATVQMANDIHESDTVIPMTASEATNGMARNAASPPVPSGTLNGRGSCGHACLSLRAAANSSAAAAAEKKLSTHLCGGMACVC
jgi:hypothetical protein